MPAYNRPRLLVRAIKSLQGQTVSDWSCRVFDDSHGDDVARAIQEIGDPRVAYVKNTPRKGAGPNIDQCFSKSSAHAAEYFFVLEDDNYLLPRFIEDNIAKMSQSGTSVLLRNQYIESYAQGEADGEVAGVTLEPFLLEKTYQPEQFRAALLLGRGISNGGLFWSAEAHSDFEVGLKGSDAVLDESLRTALVKDRVRVELSPLAVWRSNAAESTRSASRSELLSFIRNTAVLQDVRRLILSNVPKDADGRLVDSGLQRSVIDQEVSVLRLGETWPDASGLTSARRLSLRAKASLMRWAPRLSDYRAWRRRRLGHLVGHRCA
jgi:glycosyltransferase involved in cell wall biosynthesis